MTANDQVLNALLQRCRENHHRWINGDATGYVLDEQATILGGVGGWSRGGEVTATRQAVVAATWESGEGSVEMLNGGVSSEVAWISVLERAVVKFRDVAGEHRWDLRVTEVFHRAGDEWRLVHRHADPLVDRRSVLEAAHLLK